LAQGILFLQFGHREGHIVAMEAMCCGLARNHAVIQIAHAILQLFR
jgi:hypothetical protein